MNTNEIRERLQTLTLAIADAEKRIESNPTDTHYVENQRDRQSEWNTEIYTLRQRLALIENPDPITGVINLNNTNMAFSEELYDCINATWEDAFEEHRKTCKNINCRKGDHEDFKDTWDEDGSDTRLVGQWQIDENGCWAPNKTVAEGQTEDLPYAAIVRETVAQVVWSATTVRVRAMCSPCYPGQADLDSGEDVEGILAYTLPKELTEEL